MSGRLDEYHMNSLYLGMKDVAFEMVCNTIEMCEFSKNHLNEQTFSVILDLFCSLTPINWTMVMWHNGSGIVSNKI